MRLGVGLITRQKPSWEQIDHALDEIDKGKRSEDIAAVLKVDRTTFVRALAGCALASLRWCSASSGLLPLLSLSEIRRDGASVFLRGLGVP